MPERKSQVSRVTRSRAEAKAAYDRLSRRYDLLVGWGERAPKDAGLRKLGVKEGESVLEIGFGTGQCLLALAQSVGDTGRVYGVDLSEGMLEVARARIEDAGLSQRVGLKLGDATRLPLEDASVDAVFISFALELFDTPEIPVVLAECRRVLRSGGRMCVVAMSKDGQHGIALKVYEWAHEAFPRWVDCRPIFVRQALEEADLIVTDSSKVSVWGLSAEIVLAARQ